MRGTLCFSFHWWATIFIRAELIPNAEQGEGAVPLMDLSHRQTYSQKAAGSEATLTWGWILVMVCVPTRYIIKHDCFHK